MKKTALKLSCAVLLVGSLVLGTVVANPPVQLPIPPGITTYYSSAQKDNPVGEYIVTCDRVEYFLWGHASAYKDFTPTYCPPPPGDW